MPSSDNRSRHFLQAWYSLLVIHVYLKNLGLFICICSLVACVRVPEGIEPVSGFDLDRYLGKWYEIARLDHSFERGLDKVTAEYQLRDDGGVKVINRGFDVSGNEWKEATGKAYFTGAQDIGQLKVSFFGPFYGAYNIVALDKAAYQYSLVAGPNRSYLWILARTSVLAPTVVNELVQQAAALDFPTDNLIWVAHD